MHTHIHFHTSQRLCENQNAEPEGCCASDVCILYSVVPVHVGDCCTLRVHSGFVLFTLTGGDSRLLSRRAERLGQTEKGVGGRKRSKVTEKNNWLFTFLLCLFRYCFFGLALIPSPQNLCPHGSPAARQLKEGAVSLLILSSLTFWLLGHTLFCTWGIIWEP